MRPRSILRVGGLAWLHVLSLSVVLLCPTAPGHAADESPAAEACESRHAQDWIARNFSDAAVVTGDFRGRRELETPVWVRDATASDARYAFSIRETQRPNDPRAAFSNVEIVDLRSSNRYGGAIKTHRSSPGMQLFLSDVRIVPNWPDWVSYEETNFDGMVLDGAVALYAQNMIISDWNADSAIDNKALTSQLVRVEITGPGHRPLRYWQPGPHYLVYATLDRPNSGPLIWFKDCDYAVLRVYRSNFNGRTTLPDDAVACSTGAGPEIEYLEKDPRITGEMHPIFTSCDVRP